MVEVDPSKRVPRKRVRRGNSQTLLSAGVSQHLWNCLIVAVLGSITVAFLLVSRHEERINENRTEIDKLPGESSSSASSSHRLLASGKPFIIYGTAWKEDKTADFVEQAIESGFRCIDTAGQPKHYKEELVGEGWTRAAEKLNLKREDLWLQTKYSPYQENAPYDPSAPLNEQVVQSVKSSLKNLKTAYIDSLVLHSPLHTMEETLTVWKAMEAFVKDGTVKYLGISNCYDLQAFKTIFDAAIVKPFALQNRFYEKSNFDTELRQFCRENKVKYQSFWTLTANSLALKKTEIKGMAAARDLMPQTLLFAFLMSLGYVTPLSGTTNPKHMEQDVQVMKRMQDGEVIFETKEELRRMARLLGMPDL